MSNDAKNDDSKKDRMLLGSAVGDGIVPFIRESRDGRLSGGFISKDPTKIPHCDAVVSLDHKEGNVFEVTQDIPLTSRPVTDHAGPARVNGKDYRQGWDRIFGGTKTGQA
jgi:hypothetical protein